MNRADQEDDSWDSVSDGELEIDPQEEETSALRVTLSTLKSTFCTLKTQLAEIEEVIRRLKSEKGPYQGVLKNLYREIMEMKFSVEASHKIAARMLTRSTTSSEVPSHPVWSPYSGIVRGAGNLKGQTNLPATTENENVIKQLRSTLNQVQQRNLVLESRLAEMEEEHRAVREQLRCVGFV